MALKENFNLLVEKLDSPKEQDRRKAIDLLVQSRTKKALKVLSEHLQIELDPDIKYHLRKGINELKAWLSQTKKPVKKPLDLTTQRISKDLQTNDQDKIRDAFQFALEKEQIQLIPLLHEKATHCDDPFIHCQFLRLLGLDDTEQLNRVIPFLKTSDPRVLSTAIEVLEKIGTPKCQGLIIRFATHKDHRVKTTALKALINLGEEKGERVLRKLISSDKQSLRDSAAFALASINKPFTIPLLEELLHDQSESIKLKALRGLQRRAKAGNKKAMQVLRRFQTLGHKPFDEENTNIDANNEVLLHSEKPEFRLALLKEVAEGRRTLGAIQLLDRIQIEKDVNVLATAVSAMDHCEGSDRIKTRVGAAMLAHEDDRVRANAIDLMSQYIPPKHRDFFLPYLHDSSNRVQGNAILALCTDAHTRERFLSEIRTCLNTLLNSIQIDRVRTALYCISKVQDEQFLDLILNCLESHREENRKSALEFLVKWARTSKIVARELEARTGKADNRGSSNSSQYPDDDNVFLTELKVILAEEQKDTRLSAVREALKRLKKSRRDETGFRFPMMEHIPKESSIPVIETIVECLAFNPDHLTFESLQPLLNHPSKNVVLSVVKCLKQLRDPRLIDFIEDEVINADLSLHYNRLILAEGMPLLHESQSLLAWQAMESLMHGSPECKEMFLTELMHWPQKNSDLTELLLDYIEKYGQKKDYQVCSQYLLLYSNSTHWERLRKIAEDTSELDRRSLAAGLMNCLKKKYSSELLEEGTLVNQAIPKEKEFKERFFEELFSQRGAAICIGCVIFLLILIKPWQEGLAVERQDIKINTKSKTDELFFADVFDMDKDKEYSYEGEFRYHNKVSEAFQSIGVMSDMKEFVLYFPQEKPLGPFFKGQKIRFGGYYQFQDPTGVIEMTGTEIVSLESEEKMALRQAIMAAVSGGGNGGEFFEEEDEAEYDLETFQSEYQLLYDFPEDKEKLEKNEEYRHWFLTKVLRTAKKIASEGYSITEHYNHSFSQANSVTKLVRKIHMDIRCIIDTKEKTIIVNYVNLTQ